MQSVAVHPLPLCLPETAVFLLALLAFGVVATPLLGGRLGRLLDLRFRAVWLLQASVLTQIGIVYVGSGTGHAAGQRVVHLLTYAGAALFVWCNRALPGMSTVALGGGANLAAIIGNGGVMPTLPSAATTAGFAHAVDGFQNSAVSAGSPLWFFGDVFAIPAGIPLANVFSVGDVLLLAAALLMVWGTCGVKLQRPARVRLATASA